MRALVAALVATALASACGGRATAPRALAARVTGTGTREGPCETCHDEIAAEQARSFHAVASTDATFRESLSLEDENEHTFCTSCHAPGAARGRSANGVDCRSCHAAPHANEHAASNASCASCHEFTFDDGRPELVQKTLSEHRASAFADVACTTCHMARRGAHADHRFASGHDPSRIARAVHVTATREGENAVAFTIRADVGHAFPTGDMFRRARLVVFGESVDGEIVADAERTFGRTWTGVRDGPHVGRRTEATDTRIRGAWSGVVTLEDPTASLARIRWSLVYERVIAMRGSQARVASSDVIADGSIP